MALQPSSSGFARNIFHPVAAGIETADPAASSSSAGDGAGRPAQGVPQGIQPLGEFFLDTYGVVNNMETAWRRIVECEYLPDKLKEHGRQYSELTSPITGEYRGSDRPKKASITPVLQDKQCKALDDVVPCMLVFPTMQFQGLSIAHLGGFRNPRLKIRQGYTVNSQLPAVHITLVRAELPDVVVTIFGTDIARDVVPGVGERMGFSMRYGANESIVADMNSLNFEAAREAGKLAQHGGLMVLDINLQHRLLHDRFTGISAGEIDEILEKVNHRANELSDFERAIFYLRSVTALQVYRECPSTGLAQAKAWDMWFTRSICLAKTEGDFWLYQAQMLTAGSPNAASIFDASTELGLLEPARNQVLDWVCDFVDGKLVKRTAHRMMPYVFGRSLYSFPSASVMSFAMRMAIERSQPFEEAVIKESFQETEWTARATFHSHKGRPGFYVADVTMALDGVLSTTNKALAPEVGTRCEMAVRCKLYSNDDGKGEVDVITLRGAICEDVFNSKAEVVCFVRGGSDNDLEKSIQDFRTGQACRVRLTLVGQAGPASRHRVAVESLERYTDLKTHGVDITRHVLRSPPHRGPTDTLAQAFRKAGCSFESAIHRFEEVLALNAGVLNACRKSVQSKSGLTLIDGPSGTGKTLLLAIIAALHLDIGQQVNKNPQNKVNKRNVLACAPSNPATESLMRHFLSIQSKFDWLKTLEIIHFRGPLSKKPAHVTARGSDSTNHDSQHDDPFHDLVEAQWELVEDWNTFDNMDDELATYGFFVKRKTMLAQWAQSPGHPMEAKALEYYDLANKLKSGQVRSDKKREAHATCTQHLDELTRYYLRNEVDIVFSTNSSSVHPILQDNYKPAVLISDEVASTSIPDAICPASASAAILGSIQLWVLAGDHTQKRLSIVSKGRNEFQELIEKSMFEHLYTSKLLEDHICELDEPFRMLPPKRKKTRRGQKKKGKLDGVESNGELIQASAAASSAHMGETDSP